MTLSLIVLVLLLAVGVGIVVAGVGKLRSADSAAREALDTIDARAATDAELRSALSALEAAAGAAPELKVDASCLALERELAEVAGQLVFARRRYDDAARSLNHLARTPPWAWLTQIAGVAPRELHDEPEVREAPDAVA